MSRVDETQDKNFTRYRLQGKEAISEEIILWEKYLKLYKSQLKVAKLPKSKKFLQNNVKYVTRYLDELRRSLSL